MSSLRAKTCPVNPACIDVAQAAQPVLPRGCAVIVDGEHLLSTHGRVGIVVRHQPGGLVEVACWPGARRVLPASALRRLEVQ